MREAKLDSDTAVLASRATRALLADGRATIDRVAKVLGLTPRTLQRRLRSQGSSFSEVLAATRAMLAREGLANGLSVTQLAPVLGFSESSAVSRFLRESGVSRAGTRTGRAPRVDIERVTNAMYEEQNSDRWGRVAQLIGSFLQGTHVRIWVMRPKTNEVSFDQLTPGLPTFLPRVYDQHYFRTDPAIPVLFNCPSRPFSCANVVDPGEFDKTALVSDLLDRPGIDVRWRMMEAAPLHGGQWLIFAAGRARTKGPFEECDTRRHDMVFAKLRHVFDFETRIAAMKANNSVMERTLDAYPGSVFIVSKSLDVLHANQSAIGMLGRGGGLEFAFGKLQGVQMRGQAALERIVSAAVQEDEAGPQSAVIGRAGDRELRAHAYRVSRSGFVAGGARDCQVALVVTAEPKPRHGA